MRSLLVASFALVAASCGDGVAPAGGGVLIPPPAGGFSPGEDPFVPGAVDPGPGGVERPADGGPSSTTRLSPVWSVSRHSWPTDDRSLVLADLGRIADLGAKMVRTDFWWYTVQPEQNRFDEGALDYYKAYVDAAASKGLQVLVVLSNPPGWAKSLHASDNKNLFFEAFRVYASRVAEKVGTKVTYYQVWNEPNHADNLSSDDDIQLFLAGKRGLAEHDSSFKTIINLLVDSHDNPSCPNWECDFRYYMERGAAPAVDILAIDYYPGTWSAGSWGGTVIDRLFTLGAHFKKGVAIMETGYSSIPCNLVNTNDGQASWINTELPKLRAKVTSSDVNQGVRLSIANWFKLDDRKTENVNCILNPIETFEDHFGVVQTDRKPKPGFGALKTQIKLF